MVSCSQEHALLKEGDSFEVVSYEADWAEQNINDTLVMTLKQTVTYAVNGKKSVVHPQAVVKFFTNADTVLFAKGEDYVPKFISSGGSAKTSAGQPKRYYKSKRFYFDDGTVITAEAVYEAYSLSDAAVLSFAAIDDISLNSVTATQNADSNDLYDATAVFDVVWSVAAEDKNDTQNGAVSYVKKRIEAVDTLIDESLEQGLVWESENIFRLFVKKTEIWSVSGEITRETTSPRLTFYVTGKQNKTLEVSDFNFKTTVETTDGPTKDLSTDGWMIKKRDITHTILLTNNQENFSDEFVYPLYDASITIENQTFNFDLSVFFDYTARIAEKSQKTALFADTGKAVFAKKNFMAEIKTSLNLKEEQPKPDPDPVPDAPRYGQILGYTVTAVFDPDALKSNGEITKKCVVIRYEEGYDWGICRYSEAFPAKFSFVRTAYSGYNSAAKDNVGSPWQIARAADVNKGMKWYDSDNQLLSALDFLTCKIYGWQNTVSGVYSSVVNGYSAVSGNKGYELTLKAPDGSSKTFVSAKR